MQIIETKLRLLLLLNNNLCNPKPVELWYNQLRSDMRKFTVKIIEDICIITLLSERATLNISEELITLILDSSIKCSEMIIDLSICNFIDSTFIGNLIFVLKKLKENRTNLFLIKPKEEAFQIIVRMGVKDVFKFLESPSELLKPK